MKKPIRVGIVRADTHGAYFAALMAPHDPLKFQRPVPVEADPPHSWMNGAAHYYFYQFCADPSLMTVDTVDGFEIVKVWDDFTESAERLSEALNSHPQVCGNFEDVSEDVDLVFIGDCNGDGSDHLKLATPGIEKGIPTYIDKPLANSVEDVRKIQALARRHNVPIYSASILRHIPGAFQFRSRFPEIGGVESGVVRGGGTHIAGQVHTVSLAQAVFGNGITEVRAMGPGDLGIMYLSYGDRDGRPKSGVVLHHNVRSFYHCSMHISAYGPQGAIIDSKNINDFTFPYGAAEILRLIRRMMETGKADDSMDDMIEAVAAINAGRLSMRDGGRPVSLQEVDPQ